MKDASYRWHLSRATAVHDDHGNIEGWYATATDIHDLMRAEELRKLLIDELNHRVKNTLAVVQAIAKQTLRGDPADDARTVAFEGRLAALAQAHNLLAREAWEKAHLEDVASQALLARGPGSAQITLSGPPAALKPKQALSLSMALHELYTNAVKYGSLGCVTGSADFTWEIDSNAQRLKMQWVERGGPATVTPQKAGFGSVMIQQALKAELDADVTMDFQKEGLVCIIDAPLLNFVEVLNS